jgi:hypothetical protein
MAKYSFVDSRTWQELPPSFQLLNFQSSLWLSTTQNVHNIAEPRYAQSNLLNPDTQALEATWPHPNLGVNLDRS